MRTHISLSVPKSTRVERNAHIAANIACHDASLITLDCTASGQYVGLGDKKIGVHILEEGPKRASNLVSTCFQKSTKP